MPRTTDIFEQEMVAALPKVRRMLLRLCRLQEVDDYLQFACVLGLQAKASYKIGTSMAAWLYFIGKNKFLSDMRKRRREVSLPKDVVTRLSVKPVGSTRMELAETTAALELLPPEHKEVILLDADGLTLEEIAEALDIVVGTVKSRLYRGRKELERISSGH